jgi:tRNA (cmo5U34)-methyltransferase
MNRERDMSEERTDPGTWQEEDSRGFIDNGASFVPDRVAQMRAVCSTIPALAPGSRVVDLCCGEGLLSEAILLHHPNAYVHALDGSEAMLAATSRRLKAFEDRAEVCRFDLTSSDWRRFPDPPLAFVSSLAVHHLDEDQKKQLFRDVHELLADGGVLVLADVVLAAGPIGRRWAGEEWDRAVQEQGGREAFERFQAESWNMYTHELDEIDKPSTLLDQLCWMREAGFRHVDVYWLRAGHAIFGGVRGAAE